MRSSECGMRNKNQSLVTSDKGKLVGLSIESNFGSGNPPRPSGGREQQKPAQCNCVPLPGGAGGGFEDVVFRK